MNGFLMLLAVVLPLVTGLLVAFVPQVNAERKTRCTLVGASLLLQCAIVVAIAFGGESMAR